MIIIAPSQVMLSSFSSYPLGHLHSYPPLSSTQWWEQLWVPIEHSSISEWILADSKNYYCTCSTDQYMCDYHCPTDNHPSRSTDRIHQCYYMFVYIHHYQSGIHQHLQYTQLQLCRYIIYKTLIRELGSCIK